VLQAFDCRECFDACRQRFEPIDSLLKDRQLVVGPPNSRRSR
jgi:hypothetical protein